MVETLLSPGDRMINDKYHGYRAGLVALTVSIFKAWDFPGGSAVKNPNCNSRGTGSIPGLGRSPGGGNGDPL